MSKFTRNLQAIKKLNIKKDELIDHVANCNKMIGLNQKQKHCLTLLFKMKNKYFNQLCKVQDVLKLENKLNKILMTISILKDGKKRSDFIKVGYQFNDEFIDTGYRLKDIHPSMLNNRVH